MNNESTSSSIVNVIIWLFLLMSIFLLIYIYYRSEIVYQGFKSVIYFKYYIISILGVIFWGFALKLSKSVKEKIVLLVASILASLYLVEAIMSIGFIKKYSRIIAAHEQGIEFDSRSKLQVIDDYRDIGVNAVAHVIPRDFIDPASSLNTVPITPFSGISNRMTVFCNENGEYATFVSDRYGFNNLDALWDSEKVEWLLIGDSFTEGACVDPDKNIAGQIQLKTGESVINLGYSGNGPLIELATLKEYGEIKKPKKVIWLYLEENDLTENLPYEKESSFLLNYLQPGFTQNLIHKQKLINDSLSKYILSRENERRSVRSFMFLSNLRTFIKFDYQLDKIFKIDPLFAEILMEARDRVNAQGGQLYFVYLPEFSRYSSSNVDHGNYKKRNEVISIVQDLKIPVIDIHQNSFINHKDILSMFALRMNGHYSPYGYKEVANTIIQQVKKYENNK